MKRFKQLLNYTILKKIHNQYCDLIFMVLFKQSQILSKELDKLRISGDTVLNLSTIIITHCLRCYEKFDLSNRRPMSICPCQHLYCPECVSTVIFKKNNNSNCPECIKQINCFNVQLCKYYKKILQYFQKFEFIESNTESLKQLKIKANSFKNDKDFICPVCQQFFNYGKNKPVNIFKTKQHLICEDCLWSEKCNKIKDDQCYYNIMVMNICNFVSNILQTKKALFAFGQDQFLISLHNSMIPNNIFRGLQKNNIISQKLDMKLCKFQIIMGSGKQFKSLVVPCDLEKSIFGPQPTKITLIYDQKAMVLKEEMLPQKIQISNFNISQFRPLTKFRYIEQYQKTYQGNMSQAQKFCIIQKKQRQEISHVKSSRIKRKYKAIKGTKISDQRMYKLTTKHSKQKLQQIWNLFLNNLEVKDQDWALICFMAYNLMNQQTENIQYIEIFMARNKQQQQKLSDQGRVLDKNFQKLRENQYQIKQKIKNIQLEIKNHSKDEYGKQKLISLYQKCQDNQLQLKYVKQQLDIIYYKSKIVATTIHQLMERREIYLQNQKASQMIQKQINDKADAALKSEKLTKDNILPLILKILKEDLSSSSMKVTFSPKQTDKTKLSMNILTTHIFYDRIIIKQSLDEDSEWYFQKIQQSNEELSRFVEFQRKRFSASLGISPQSLVFHSIGKGCQKVVASAKNTSNLPNYIQVNLARNIQFKNFLTNLTLAEVTYDPKGYIEFPDYQRKRIMTRGNWPYYQPIKSVRYGIKVEGMFQNENNDWLGMKHNPGEWAVGFHGVMTPQNIFSQQQNLNVIQNILKNLKNPQKYKVKAVTLTTGRVQKYGEYKCVNKPGDVGEGVYFCCHFDYAFKRAQKKSQSRNYTLVLQCRLKPEDIRICPRQDFWVINRDKYSSIRPYGIIVTKFNQAYPPADQQYGKRFQYEDYRTKIQQTESLSKNLSSNISTSSKSSLQSSLSKKA